MINSDLKPSITNLLGKLSSFIR